MGEVRQKRGFCTPRRCCSFFCCLLVLAVIAVIVWYFTIFKSGDEALASCGECFCVVGEGESCPTDRKPQTNYTEEFIDLYWKRQDVANAYSLTCDPFTDAGCSTQPPQNKTLLEMGDNAACALHIVDPITDCQDATYTLKTYESIAAATAAGGFVTHLGHCGVCSTLQDLAVYMAFPDLTTEGKFCSSKDTVSIEGGAACYQNLGMTESCAKIWAEAEANTFVDCFTECFLKDIIQDKPNNGPFPQCELNECLQCDEDRSAQVVAKIAGRTRRRSGLLSPVARKCEELAFIDHSTCPDTIPL